MSQSSFLVDACTCNFLQSCSISVTLPFAWIQESVAFRGGFLTRFATRVSHDVYPLGCPTCHRVVSRPWLESRGSAGKLVSLLWTEYLGDSGNGGTTLEFLSPFLWRAPPLEMRRERQEYLPDHLGKGSLLWNYEAETGLLCMWAGLSCLISSGDGYVGELLELQEGCEGPFGSSRA